MPHVVSILSWNIQILGNTKIGRNLAANLLAAVIVEARADVVAVQELVFASAAEVKAELIAALAFSGQQWTGTTIAALPGGSDRDGYLFLWRSDRYAQQKVDDAPHQNNFEGEWPANENDKHGRRPGFVGLTLANGTHPFIVAAYHAPTKATISGGSAPATGLKALETNATQLTDYGKDKSKYEARFFCADFNLDITQATNEADWYTPAANATGTTPVTRAATFLYAENRLPSPVPTTSAGFHEKNLDNILAGPPASLGAVTVFDTVEFARNRNVATMIEAFLFNNELPNAFRSNVAQDRYRVVRRYVSDHLPIVAQLTLVP